MDSLLPKPEPAELTRPIPHSSPPHQPITSSPPFPSPAHIIRSVAIGDPSVDPTSASQLTTSLSCSSSSDDDDIATSHLFELERQVAAQAFASSRRRKDGRHDGGSAEDEDDDDYDNSDSFDPSERLRQMLGEPPEVILADTDPLQPYRPTYQNFDKGMDFDKLDCMLSLLEQKQQRRPSQSVGPNLLQCCPRDWASGFVLRYLVDHVFRCYSVEEFPFRHDGFCPMTFSFLTCLDLHYLTDFTVAISDNDAMRLRSFSNLGSKMKGPPPPLSTTPSSLESSSSQQQRLGFFVTLLRVRSIAKDLFAHVVNDDKKKPRNRHHHHHHHHHPVVPLYYLSENDVCHVFPESFVDKKEASSLSRHVVIPNVLSLMGVVTEPHIDYFGVFDGRGGNSLARLCQYYLHAPFCRLLFELDPENIIETIEDALKQGFLDADRQFAEFARQFAPSVGCCAAVAVVLRSSVVGDHVFFASLGDTTAVLFQNDEPVLLSKCHTLLEATRRTPSERRDFEYFMKRRGYRELGDTDSAPVPVQPSDVTRGFGFLSRRPGLLGRPDVVKRRIREGSGLTDEARVSRSRLEKIARPIPKPTEEGCRVNRRGFLTGSVDELSFPSPVSMDSDDEDEREVRQQQQEEEGEGEEQTLEKTGVREAKQHRRQPRVQFMYRCNRQTDRLSYLVIATKSFWEVVGISEIAEAARRFRMKNGKAWKLPKIRRPRHGQHHGTTPTTVWISVGKFLGTLAKNRGATSVSVVFTYV